MSKASHSIVCKEIFDKTSDPPTDEEIKEYALKIGIDLEKECFLLPLAIDGLTRPLPAHWQPCYHVETQNWYYFNFKTKETIWEHPYDELYRNVVIKAKYLAQEFPDDSVLELCKPLMPDFEILEGEILSAVTEEMLPNKGFNLSSNPLSYSSSGALNRKPTLMPLQKSGKKKQAKNDALKSSLKLSNPLSQKSPISPVSNSQVKDRSLNSSSVISTSGFSSLDSKQKYDLSLYDHLNEYDDDYISSLASERKAASKSEQIKKIGKNDSRKGTVRFHLSNKDSGNEDESNNKISIDDVASLGLSTDSGIITLSNQSKAKAKSALTLMGGGSAFLKKPGKTNDKQGDAEYDLEMKKELSDNENMPGSNSSGFPSHDSNNRRKKLISSKSISAQNLSEFPTSKPLLRSNTVDAQNYETLIGNDDSIMNNNTYNNSIRKLKSDDETYINLNNVTDNYSESLDDQNVNNLKFLNKNRNSFLTDNETSELKTTDIDSSSFKSRKLIALGDMSYGKDEDSQNSYHEKSVNKSSTKASNAPKKVLNIRFGLDDMDSLSSSASNAFNSQEISEEEESAKLTTNVTETVRQESSRNLTSNAFRRSLTFTNKDKVIAEDPQDDSIIDKDFSLKSDNSLLDTSSVGNYKRASALQKVLQESKNDAIVNDSEKPSRSMFKEAAGSSHFSHLQGSSNMPPEAEKESKSQLVRVLERVQGLGGEEETESTKQAAEIVNRLEKSIEDKLKSKKEKTMELDRSLSELDEKLSKLNKYKEEEMEKQSKNIEKLLVEMSTDNDKKIHSLKEMKKREIEEVQLKGEKELKSLRQKMDVEREILEKSLKEMESNYDERLDKVKREGDEQIAAMKEELAQELTNLRQSNKDALSIAKHENQSYMDEIFDQHKGHIERIQDMFAKEEALLELKHKEKIEALEGMVYKVDKDCLDFAQLSREYEKLRCKYRILEDKYNGLKEKFLQMRNDIRLSVERKRQAKATAKFHQQYRQKARETSGEETDISIVQTRSLTDRPRKKRLDLFSNSDSKGDTTSTSLSIPSRFLSNKESNFRPFKNDEPIVDFQLSSNGVKSDRIKSNPNEAFSDSSNGPGQKLFSGFEHSTNEPMKNPKECLRKQLDKLEEIDSELPPSSHADSYLRYPFIEIDSKLNDQLDAEIEFYRHRLLLEYDNVVRAKEKLREDEQKVMQSKHSVPNTQLSTLQRLQLEDELSSLESSVERTRALLTEKFKRLRLMHQTLDAALNIPLDQNMAPVFKESFPSSPPLKPELQFTAKPPTPKAEKPPILTSKPQISPAQSSQMRATLCTEPQNEQPSKSDAIHEKISELKDWLKKVSASSKP